MTPGVITSVRNAFSGRRLFFLVLLLVSGVIIWRPLFLRLLFSIPVIRFALMLHSFAAVALIVVIMVHIYAALLGERHDYRHGGRMGYQRLGEETSPALVP